MKFSDKKGFTLIEIVVVVAVIAVVAAIALPSYLTWSRLLNYKEASWGVMTTLNYGRQLAVSDNREHRVEFDIANEQYRLMRGNLSSGSSAWTELRPWAALPAEVNWSTGAACTGSANINIEFNPNGSADAGVICIKDTGGAVKFKVNVSSTSGRVYLD